MLQTKKRTKLDILTEYSQPRCPDCGVAIGQEHKTGCDVERCSECKGQRFSCNCSGHDSKKSYWAGIWPGVVTCIELNLFAKLVPGKGWVRCSLEDPEAVPDLNTLCIMRLKNNRE